MPADQAAGLRRRLAQQPPCCVHCFFDAAESTLRLAQALHQRGWTSLLIDTCGRVFADCPTRNLFGWKQQLERGQLHTLPMPYGDGWYAPGMQGDEPALMTIAQGYDCVIFDASLNVPGWASLPDAAQVFVMEVKASHVSTLHGYALLKTLSHAGAVFSVGLLGDAAACDHLQAACKQFLDPSFTQAVYSVAHEDDAFAALAVRMAHEEAGVTARHKTESTGNMALKHGW